MIKIETLAELLDLVRSADPEGWEAVRNQTADDAMATLAKRYGASSAPAPAAPDVFDAFKNWLGARVPVIGSMCAACQCVFMDEEPSPDWKSCEHQDCPMKNHAHGE